MNPTDFFRDETLYDSETGVELPPEKIARLEIINGSCQATSLLVEAIQTVKETIIDKQLLAGFHYCFNELFELIGDYIVLISRFNSSKARTGSDSYEVDELKRLDESRKIKHDALISQIKITERFLVNKCNYRKSIVPEQVILEQRETVTIWAKEVYLCLAQIKEEFKKN